MAGSARPAEPRLRPRSRPRCRRGPARGGLCRGGADRRHGAASAAAVDGRRHRCRRVQLGRGDLLRRCRAPCPRLAAPRDVALPHRHRRTLQLCLPRCAVGQDPAQRRRRRDRGPVSGPVRPAPAGGRADAAATAARLYDPAPQPGGGDAGAGLVVVRCAVHGAAGAGAHVGDHRRSQISDRDGQGMAAHGKAVVGPAATPVLPRRALPEPDVRQWRADILVARQRLGARRPRPYDRGDARRFRRSRFLPRPVPPACVAQRGIAGQRRPVERQPARPRRVSRSRNLRVGAAAVRPRLGRQPWAVAARPLRSGGHARLGGAQPARAAVGAGRRGPEDGRSAGADRGDRRRPVRHRCLSADRDGGRRPVPSGHGAARPAAGPRRRTRDHRHHAGPAGAAHRRRRCGTDAPRRGDEGDRRTRLRSRGAEASGDDRTADAADRRCRPSACDRPLCARTARRHPVGERQGRAAHLWSGAGGEGAALRLGHRRLGQARPLAVHAAPVEIPQLPRRPRRGPRLLRCRRWPRGRGARHLACEQIVELAQLGDAPRHGYRWQGRGVRGDLQTLAGRRRPSRLGNAQLRTADGVVFHPDGVDAELRHRRAAGRRNRHRQAQERRRRRSRRAGQGERSPDLPRTRRPRSWRGVDHRRRRPGAGAGLCRGRRQLPDAGPGPAGHALRLLYRIRLGPRARRAQCRRLGCAGRGYPLRF